jgi:hypothetical protein
MTSRIFIWRGVKPSSLAGPSGSSATLIAAASFSEGVGSEFFLAISERVRAFGENFKHLFEKMLT